MKRIQQYRNMVWLIVLFPFLHTSCTKELVIDIKDIEKKIVVHCLFSEDKSWDVVLLYTKNMKDSTDTPVENATVQIINSSNHTLQLNYTENGHYRSDIKPNYGETYRLIVNVPGFDEISAESSIPLPVQANIEPFEINWITYMFPNDLLDRDVFPITINFEKQRMNVPVVFRALLFNLNYGYKRYLLSSSALQKLERIGIPTIAVSRLEKLTDKWQMRAEVFYDCFKGTGTIDMELNYYNLLVLELKERTVNTREYEAFYSTECFANDEWLNNISIDTRTIFGMGELVEKADLFYADPNLKYLMESGNYNNSDKREYWVEVAQCSLDYYEYYRTYILQVSQRINPYSEPVPVHSNIKNGVGIFAGFNRQMLHVLTYK